MVKPADRIRKNRSGGKVFPSENDSRDGSSHEGNSERSYEKPFTRPWFLGIECGATHSVAILADDRLNEIRRCESGPANCRLHDEASLTRHLRGFADAFPIPDALVIGVAGARTEADRAGIRRAATSLWGPIPLRVTHDLDTALAAAEPSSGEGPAAQLLVLSGTGSCCYGKNTSGKTVRVGGWGHLLGDRGSGYEIALQGLKTVLEYWDHRSVWPRLGQRLLRALQLNEPDQLIAWIQNAAKHEIAALTPEIFSAWHQGDAIASGVVQNAADRLAADALACASRLTRRKASPVRVVLAGSVMLKQPAFVRLFKRKLTRSGSKAKVTPLKRESAWGAVELARSFYQTGSSKVQSPDGKASRARGATTQSGPVRPPSSLPLSPTEERHPRSMRLDSMPIHDAINLMLDEEATVTQALSAERKKLERGIRLIARIFKRGGRLFYVGAGTSGRLGVLDASECPPTFRVSPEQVQGIIAGGQTALWRAVEGAEDDPRAGARAVAFRGVTKRDVLVGIAASGRTPFVWGALQAARDVNAATVLLCFNPRLKIPRESRPDLVIAPDLGPEILTGSTRLKAGTATKLVLNLFTTLAMVQCGKVIENLMIDLDPTNTKLRDRAVRIVQTLAGVDAETAITALETNRWVIKTACAKLKRKRKKP